MRNFAIALYLPSCEPIKNQRGWARSNSDHIFALRERFQWILQCDHKGRRLGKPPVRFFLLGRHPPQRFFEGLSLGRKLVSAHSLEINLQTTMSAGPCRNRTKYSVVRIKMRDLGQIGKIIFADLLIGLRASRAIQLDDHIECMEHGWKHNGGVATGNSRQVKALDNTS